MKSKILSVVSAGLLMLPGCSSTPTRVDRGPLPARTFCFMPTPAKPGITYADVRPDLQAQVQQAIERNLTSKGLAKLSTGGDLTVGFLVIISDGASTWSINDYFGYSQGAPELQDKAHEAFAVDHKNPTPYPAGTLVIDIIDAKTFQLLHRNFACRPVLRNLPLEQRQARLQEAVDEALKKVRLAK